jgi:ribosome maturation factor RimP
VSDRLQVLVAQTVTALGYELVECRVGGARGRPVLDVRIDRLDGLKVQVSDCEKVSRGLEAELDAVPELATQRYVLEVSSPGVERPLNSLKDWRRFVGRRATVKSARFAAVGGHVEVEIVSAADPGAEAKVVVRDLKGTEHELALAEIERARLAVHWQT